jgi:predicted transposase YdaD
MLGMSDITFEEVFEEYGLTAKWETKGWKKGLEEGWEKGREEGWEKGREEAVKRLGKYGMEPEQIAEALELPLGTVLGYLQGE